MWLSVSWFAHGKQGSGGAFWRFHTFSPEQIMRTIVVLMLAWSSLWPDDNLIRANRWRGPGAYHLWEQAREHVTAPEGMKAELLLLAEDVRPKPFVRFSRIQGPPGAS
jgi:hypothetical protein